VLKRVLTKVTSKKLFNIYFLIVIIAKSYGEHCWLLSTYRVQ
jgi:hypothetical protein